MDEHKLWPTTILVILSDHGESLGEHGESSHGVFVYDSTVRVPLMILAPGIKPVRIPYQVRLADVAPTLAALTGLKNQPEYDGQNLTPWMQGKGKDLLAYSESYYTNLLMGWAPLFSIRSSKGKWIDAKTGLYDLVRDPREIKNLYAANRVPAEFRAELNLRTKSVMEAASESIDPETKEKLASLGYITGSSAKSISSGFDPKDGIGVWTRIEEAVIHAQWGDLEKSKTIFLEVLRQQPENHCAQISCRVLRRKATMGRRSSS
jgi:hypothetical protein